MGRNELWTTEREIEGQFDDSNNPNVGAGPILYVKNGKKLVDDSENHIGVVGSTGKGKSQCSSLPYTTECLKKRQSVIVLDPKKEVYNRTIGFVPEDYQTFCVDFREPYSSPTKWNPIEMPRILFKSNNIKDNDIACSQVSEFANGTCPWDGHSDKFWTDASANLIKGLIYSLFECAEPEFANMDSVAIMMEQAEIRQGVGTVLKSFYDSLPNDSLAKRNLATYVTAPNDTRASIHSVASSCIETFSRSKGLMNLLCEDTLDILNINVEKPFILYIVMPDETDVYDGLAGLLVSQMTQHLIRVAQERGGKLPIRVNVILEELGSVGKSIPTLPNLMVAGRSRGIRMMLILQSNSQLIDVYGKSKAETINSCIGITIGFSTNNWETLNEWSQRCGERQICVNGHIVKEPLITASQLAAMPTATALVMVNNQYKFISSFPFYNEMYDKDEWSEQMVISKEVKRKAKTINFEEFVAERRKRKLAEISSEANKSKGDFHGPFSERRESSSGLDIDSIVSKIDAKIAQLEKEEKAEKRKIKDYTVVIMASESENDDIAQILAKHKRITIKAAKMLISKSPIEVSFKEKSQAVAFCDELSDCNHLAMLRENKE